MVYLFTAWVGGIRNGIISQDLLASQVESCSPSPSMTMCACEQKELLKRSEI